MNSTASARSLRRADLVKGQTRVDYAELVGRSGNAQARRMCLHFGQLLSYSAARGVFAGGVHVPAHCRTPPCFTRHAAHPEPFRHRMCVQTTSAMNATHAGAR